MSYALDIDTTLCPRKNACVAFSLIDNVEYTMIAKLPFLIWKAIFCIKTSVIATLCRQFIRTDYISAYLFEIWQGLYVKYKLLPQIARFAREQQVDALWVVLKGQTLIRLAKGLSHVLSLPLFTQVWDPFELWLRHQSIDRFTRRRFLTMFDKVIKKSSSCATTSWAMTEAYTEKYAVKNRSLISSLPVELARMPATSSHSEDEFIIGIAGQIYAVLEWNSLIDTLNETHWKIANRRIRIRVLSNDFALKTQKPSNIEYLGWQSQEDTMQLLTECDLLYLPYWFSESFRKETTYCFPSKLITYLASGRPVFCHAPPYASPYIYITQHEAGFVCDSLDPQNIRKSLEKVILNTEHYAKIKTNASACFLRDFTLESMRKSFFQLLGFNYDIFS